LKLAFCLYKYFPYGGLQRDFLRIAQDCQQRGHQIRVYTLSWSGDIPAGFDVIIVPVTAITNHTRYEKYSRWVADSITQSPVDCVVGINKMPGLDVYFAADSCYEKKARSQRVWAYRLLPRYKHFAEYEKAVFSVDSEVEILMISKIQEPFFKQYYDTPNKRLHFLPPGISRDRIAPANFLEIRNEKRKELLIPNDEHMVLMVGSGFIKKGLRRAIYAIKSLPKEVVNNTRLYIAGEDNESAFRRQAGTLRIMDRIVFMSGRDDVSELMLAADLLLHPALDENAGIVLLEAIVAGLPVLATDVCGYGHYVEEADVGELVPSPFRQEQLNEKLLRLLLADRRQEWRENGRRFSGSADIYSLAREAVRVIETVGVVEGDMAQSRGVLAFCLFNYFPFGGLQRDFVRIAEKCRERGYQIRVYTLSWQGECPNDFDVVLVPIRAFTNHKKNEKYAAWVAEHLRSDPVKGVIGFNKMPGLDIYYAADACYLEKAQTQRGYLYRLISRYKHFSTFEKAVFKVEAETKILMIAELQIPLFQKHYLTPTNRFHVLPPGISPDRMAPENSDRIEQSLRAEFQIGADDYLLLMVGSGFVTKGLDRILLGMSSLPDKVRNKTTLIAVGQDNPKVFLRMAKKLGLQSRVIILSEGRDDIPRFLLAADLLVHPAYTENTGTTLLEAMVAGLPVLATDVCGYAHYVKEARAGKLVISPYQQSMFDDLLLEMLLSDEKSSWQQNGVNFGKYADIYNMPDRAADVIADAIG